MTASGVVHSSAASWDLILGYGRKRRGLKWATLLLVALFVLMPVACGVKQYRAASVIFDSSEKHVRSYDAVLQRIGADGPAAFSASVDRLRLAQRYPEISAAGLLDDRMRVSQIASPARTSGAGREEGVDGGTVLGADAGKREWRLAIAAGLRCHRPPDRSAWSW